jgi:trimethylamine--corrinoid protein Co-methyltransferase
LTISHEQLVIDNEIIGMARRAVRGIDVSVDKLAFATIREAQPGGSYVESEHTLDYLNEEFIEPMLADRSDREDWERMGMEGIGDKARKRAREILESARQQDDSSLIERQMDKRIRQRFKIVAPYR